MSDNPTLPHSDTRRLDALDSLKLPPGYGWILRDSNYRRGPRLYSSSGSNGRTFPDVRSAIDNYFLNKEKEAR